MQTAKAAVWRTRPSLPHLLFLSAAAFLFGADQAGALGANNIAFTEAVTGSQAACSSASTYDCDHFYRPQTTGMSMTYVVVNQPY